MRTSTDRTSTRLNLETPTRSPYQNVSAAAGPAALLLLSVACSGLPSEPTNFSAASGSPGSSAPGALTVNATANGGTAHLPLPPTPVHPSGSGSGSPSPPSSFRLTSSAFSNNGVIPLMHAAPFATGGGNVSPPLGWSGRPTGTMSYAIIMKDVTVPGTHWVIYDIPASITSLGPNAVPGGAKEGVELTGRHDYTGPFPPLGQTNTYEFTLYAVSVSALPGVPAPAAGMPTVTSRTEDRDPARGGD